MQKKVNDYKADLLADLRDPEYAAGYLSGAIVESPETFLLALRDVAEAQKGMTKVASEAGVNRENLYRMLSEEGNPRFSSLYAVLEALGLRIAVATGRYLLPHSEAGQSELSARSQIGESRIDLGEGVRGVRGFEALHRKSLERHSFADDALFKINSISSIEEAMLMFLTTSNQERPVDELPAFLAPPSQPGLTGPSIAALYQQRNRDYGAVSNPAR